MRAFTTLPDLWVFLQSRHVLKGSKWSSAGSELEMGGVCQKCPASPLRLASPPRPGLQLRLTLGLRASLFYPSPTLRQDRQDTVH